MKFSKTVTRVLLLAMCGWGLSAHAIVITNSSDANVLAGAIAGSGISISNTSYSGASGTASGTFTGAAANGLGFDSGIVLTTGTTSCVPGPNNSESCTGSGAATSLSFDFTTSTGSVFFQYVFGSEEYNEYVGSVFNDSFSLLLDGTNIALVPGGGGIVSINNVNSGSNSAYYRNNSGTGSLSLQYDGFTTVLTASATGLGSGLHSFNFYITDVGDSSWDSGVFIQAGTFSGTSTVPEPTSLVLLGLGLLGLGFRHRRHS